jgi:hypothetical protein
MRWKQKEETRDGTQRIVTRFLFFPKTLFNETRWLEFAQILQTWNASSYRDIDGEWEDIRWADIDDV